MMHVVNRLEKSNKNVAMSSQHGASGVRGSVAIPDGEHYVRQPILHNCEYRISGILA